MKRCGLVRPTLAAAIVVVILGGTTSSTLGQERLSIEGLRAPVAVARDADDELPREYAALGLTRFSEWTALDSVTIVKGLAFQLSFDLDDLGDTEALVAYTRAGDARGFNGQAADVHSDSSSEPAGPFVGFEAIEISLVGQHGYTPWRPAPRSANRKDRHHGLRYHQGWR